MKIKAFGIVLLLAINIFLLCSCSYTKQSYADELTSSIWYAENENKTQITLSFPEDNTAEINIKGDTDNTCTISGICTVNEETLVISDMSMAKNISIDYKVYGNKVELTYMGSTITLEKYGDNTT
ncbi:MAG: hypothetical protein PUD24_02285 [Oscillospiraceae bacterium]|nr:hypothetical protein [Oscillospiraceae bacterium]